jgi:peptide/nickel transport system substrate-binding protein
MIRWHGVVAGAGAAALLALATACGSGGGATAAGGASAAAGKTLGIGLQTAIPSMNPVLNPVSPTLAYAYDPLVYLSDGGTYVPDLAVSWGYVGRGNVSFQLTLRPGVKFADGAALTAQAVKNSLGYFLKTPNPNLLSAGPIKSVQVISPRVVRINYSRAFPDAAESLTQFYGIGLIIGPKGLASPKSLETVSDGVGQYALDSAASRAGSVYTFTASPTYFDKSAIRYKSVQLRIYPSANSRLSALQSGQIQDATQIPVDQVGTSAAASFQRYRGNTTWMLVQFLNTSSGPLASRAVRQATEDAIDRAAIAKAFYSGLATPQDQFSPAGTTGYAPSLDSAYTYNPATAKHLLSQGGYPDGFTLKLLDNAIADPGGLLGQLFKSELAKVGINVQLKVDSGTFAQFQQDLSSGGYGAVMWNMSSVDLYSTATQTIVSPHTLLNPTSSADPSAMRLLNAAAAAAGPASVAAALQRLNAYLTTQALGVPIVTRTNVDLVSSSVRLPSATYVTPQANMIGPQAALEFGSK